MHAYIPRAAVAAALLLPFAACSDPAPTEPVAAPPHDLLYESGVAGAPRLSLLALDGGAPVPLAPGLVARDPAPSPGGLWVAYVVEDVQAYEIDVWIARRDGSEARRLTDHWEIDDQPAWSPDGTRLAFRSWRANSAEGDIWVMNADGSGLRNLTPDPLPAVTAEMRPAWSPDGARIAFASNRGGDVDIWTVRPDGTDFRRITATPDYDTEPTWSPDGRWIAFRRSAPGIGSDLMVVSAAGGEPRRLALAGEQRQPAWSPDGSLIAFVYQPAFNRGQAEIQTVRPDGTGVQTRTADPGWGGGLNPSWMRR